MSNKYPTVTPSQISKMELNGQKESIIFARNSILVILEGSELASAY